MIRPSLDTNLGVPAGTGSARINAQRAGQPIQNERRCGLLSRISGGLTDFSDGLLQYITSPNGQIALGLLSAGRPQTAPTQAGANIGPAIQNVLRQQSESGLIQARTLNELSTASARSAAAANPFASVPDKIFESFDPASVIAAIQSRDPSQLIPIGPDADKTTKILNDLGDDLRAESKDFAKVDEAFVKIQAAATNPSPAGDLALIFNFMKVLDPGSTVREGEFANAQNSGSVPQRFRALYNQVIEGTRLTETQRADFLRQSQRLFNSAAGLQQKRNKRFRQRAINAKIPDILIDPILPSAQFVDISPLDLSGNPNIALPTPSVVPEPLQPGDVVLGQQ